MAFGEYLAIAMAMRIKTITPIGVYFDIWVKMRQDASLARRKVQIFCMGAGSTPQAMNSFSSWIKMSCFFHDFFHG